MSIEIEAFKAPMRDNLEEWLATPRPAQCGELFRPSTPMWDPDKLSADRVNWQAAIRCVPDEWKCWLHAALAYRMAEVSQRTVAITVSVLSRAAQANLAPLNKDHLIALRERFNAGEFASLVSFMRFWHECESLDWRPPHALIDAYNELPRKKQSKSDPVLSLDPETGPFTQLEQDALHQWLHEQFCHKVLDPERYLYVRLLMIYGQRGVQMRMIVFDDFIRQGEMYKIRIHWAKQRDENQRFRSKPEIFNLDEDLYHTIQAYKMIILSRLKCEFPGCVDWDKAISNVPLFRRKLELRNNFSKDQQAPVLIESNDFIELEHAPYAFFHAPKGTPRFWLESMENMSGFPVSSRTHRPLKISKGHRFRYTMGTDLSNAGLDEWSIAHALLHKSTLSVRKYRQVSAELMSLIDEKMSDHLAMVVQAFSGTIIKDRTLAKNGARIDRQIEDLAVCGAESTCHLDTPFSCYACSKFQPILDANHSDALDRMERRRAQVITLDKTTGALWDRAILACRKVIIDCKEIRESSNVGGQS